MNNYYFSLHFELPFTRNIILIVRARIYVLQPKTIVW